MTLSSLQVAANARDFIRLVNVELNGKDKEKTGLPDLPIQGPIEIAK